MKKILSLVFFFFSIFSSASATTVLQWNDKSGNGENLYQLTTANQPSYNFSALNNLGGVVLNGSNDYMTTVDQDFSRYLYGSSGVTVFLVQKSLSDSQGSVGFSSSSNGNNQRWQIYNPYANNWYFDVGNLGNRISAPTSSFTSVGNHIITSATNYATSYGVARYDGTVMVSSNSIGTTSDPSCLLSIGTFYFCNSSVNPSYFNGTFYEILVYNTYLNPTQYESIENYLSCKWNISITGGTGCSSVVSPKSIAGLSGWWDANDLSTLVLIGLPTSGQWNDLSGNGENLYQTNPSNEPTFEYNGINGLNGVSFSSANDNYLISSDTNYSRLLNDPKGMSMFFVQSPTNPATSSFDLFSGNSTYFNFQNSGQYWDWDYSSGSRLQVATPSSGAHLWNLESLPSSTRFVNLDGTTVSTIATGAISNYSCPFSVGDAQGCTNTLQGTIPSWNGVMGEIILYNQELSTSDYQKIEGYLAWKWHLQANLPITHPYYLFPPYGSNPLKVIGIAPAAWYDANNLLGNYNQSQGGSLYPNYEIQISLGYASGTVSTSNQYNVQPVIAYNDGQLTTLRAVSATGSTDNGNTVFTVYKNGISIGTIQFSSGQSTAVAKLTSPTSISANDVLTMSCTSAGTIQNVSVYVEGKQQGV